MTKYFLTMMDKVLGIMAETGKKIYLYCKVKAQID
jgi:hypothetical protein